MRIYITRIIQSNQGQQRKRAATIYKCAVFGTINLSLFIRFAERLFFQCLQTKKRKIAPETSSANASISALRALARRKRNLNFEKRT